MKEKKIKEDIKATIIAFDFDDVIFNYMKAMIIYLKKYRTDCDNLDCTTYDLKEKLNLTDRGLRKLLNDFARSTEMAAGEAIEGAYEGLKKLIRSGYKVVVVTSRTSIEMPSARKWMRENMPEIADQIKMHSIKSFGKDRIQVTKGEACEILGASFHFDDRFDHCKSVKDKGIKACLVDRPWNKKEKNEEAGIPRSYSFEKNVAFVMAA